MSTMVESRDTVVSFPALDGREINLIHVESAQAPTKGPVMLVHGAGVRADIFRPPGQTSLIDLLLAEGYDVWLLNWRASIDLPPNEWTLDQAAAFDHPAAVSRVLSETGAETMQAVVHCQGSTSFVMSAVAGLLPEVTTIVSNAVSLHPTIRPFSELKIHWVAPLIARFSPYLNPAWGDTAEAPFEKAIAGLVRLTHHECDNEVCKGVSFTYGTGFPCLWSHDNLSDGTHEWLRGQFAECPLSFFAQMSECVRRGHLVSVSHLDRLPRDYTAEPPRTDARFVLFAGEDNLCFLPDSQERSFDFFDTHRPGQHALHVVPGYGHLDMFMGQNAAQDVFPQIMEELE